MRGYLNFRISAHRFRDIMQSRKYPKIRPLD